MNWNEFGSCNRMDMNQLTGMEIILEKCCIRIVYNCVCMCVCKCVCVCVCVCVDTDLIHTATDPQNVGDPRM